MTDVAIELGQSYDALENIPHYFNRIRRGIDMPNEKLLIVEDDRTTASIIKMYVQKYDYQVVDIVSTGEKAIRAVKRYLPDLVLMDIKLEGDLDGITAAKTIIYKLNVPVVFITSHHDEDILERARLTDHSGFINKPLREVDLRTTIDFAVSKKKIPGFQEKKQKLNVHELIKSYELTKSESNIVMKLIKNPDTSIVLSDNDITINTMRTHLKHIYRKTKTNSKPKLLMKVVAEFDCS